MDATQLERPDALGVPAQQPVAVARPNPFHVERVLVPWSQGQSCADILLTVQDNFDYWPSTKIMIDGMTVRREYWHRVYPKPGTSLSITCQPRGGDAFRTLAIIALVIAAPQIGAFGGFLATGANASLSFAAASSIGTAITIGVGMLAINALLPPDVPQFEDGEKVSQSLSIAGARNRFKPFGVKPVPLGKIKMFPYYAAAPVTDNQGDDQYVTMLFVVGGHNVQVDDIKIGNTDINTFSDVRLELDTGGTADTGPITLYTNTVKESNVGILLRNDGEGDINYGVSTTEPGTQSVIYDIYFPQGLVKLKQDGDREKLTVTVNVEWSLNGINWNTLDRHTFTSRSSSVIREGFSRTLPVSGEVTIRMWRNEKDHHTQNPNLNAQWVDDCYFATLRSLVSENPVNDPNWGAMAINIRASDQLQGTPDEVNCIATSIIPDWNGSAWVDGPTNNPASIARWVLTGAANPRPLAVDRLDDSAFQQWHDFCGTKKFYYNKLIDYTVTIWDLFREVCHAGRARPLQIDGQFTVRIDKEQDIPLQVFSPRNSWGFTGNKLFPDIPHALRVRYIDSRGSFENEEMIVYDYGYNSENATLFESVEYQGVTDWDHVWSMARYTLAAIRLQPESFSFSADIEQLAVLPSDRIEYQQDAVLVGLGAARVKAINLLTVTLDAEVPMLASGTYAVQFRHADATTTTQLVDAPLTDGYYAELTFSDTGLVAAPAEVQDLAVFGESGKITFPLIVRNITPGADYSAKLECLPYNPALYTADTGSIPDYDPLITAPPGSLQPSIVQVRSDESVMTLDASGNWQVRILGDLGFTENRTGVASILIQTRDWDSGTNITAPWITQLTLPGDSKEFSLFGFTGGDEVQIRARYIFTSGLSSPWVLWIEPDSDEYHTVIGKLTPPPEPDELNVTLMSDGTRFYSYGYSDPTIIPPDFFGVLIRYVDTDLLDGSPIDFELVDGESWDLVDGVNTFDLVQTNLTADWGTMVPMRIGRITEGGYEANTPGQGTWIFAIKAVDTGGRESITATYTLPIELPIPRKGNNLAYRSEFANLWGTEEVPGVTLTGCFFNAPDGFLYANPIDTLWTGMPTWDTNPTWQSGFVSQAIFQQDDDFWDFESPVTITWDLRWTIDQGTLVAEIIVDGAAPVAWVPGADYTGTTFAFKLTITSPDRIAIREFVQEAFTSAG